MRSLLVAALAAWACSNSTAPPAPTKPDPWAAGSASATVVADGATNGGTVRNASFKSDALGVDKRYNVYLPVGYETSGKRYPVFYYLHGLGGDEDNWLDSGAIDKAADALALQAIIVMPDGDDGFYINGEAPIDYDACMKDGSGLFIPAMQNRAKTCVRKRDYETYIIRDLVAHVDATYRTIATREGRAIAGLSMGGFGAMELSMRHPDLFSAAASHSGVVAPLYGGPFPYQKGKVELLTDVRVTGGAIIEIVRWMVGLFGKDIARWHAHDPATLVAKLKPGMLALFIDCGTEDEFALQNQAAYLHDLLLDRGIQHEFFLGPGRHRFDLWKQRVPESLRFLRDHTSKPT